MPTLNLPATTFIGRTEELAEIATLLADPNCRLLTLVGVGGIGKTRLAVEAARQLPFSAVHFVALQPLNSADFLVASIADATGFQFYSDSDPKQQLLDYLSDKHWLLVLDNFEHLLDGVALVTDILQASPDVKLLVTSRERLNVQEEWALALDGLRIPNDQADEPLESYSAVQLFVQRARQAQVGFSLDANVEAVKVICQRVEGMPLGLELAASWLRAMSCQQIAVQMTGSLDFLTTPLRNVPERHRSLRVVFEHSWNLLSDAERNVLARLSVFRGGFDLDAAEQVVAATLTLLVGLVDKSLIRLNPNGRYDLHELLRQYAAGKLTPEETSTTASRHLDYFLTLAEQAEYIWGRDEQAWNDRLDNELDNLRAALAWSVQNEVAEAGLRLAAALAWFWEGRGHRIEGLELLERILAFTEDASPSARAKALRRAGDIAATLGAEKQADKFFDQALTLARQTNDRWNLAWALSSHAQFSTRNALDQAAAMLEESLSLFREINDLLGINWVLRGRAWVALAQGDYPYANRLLEQALMDARDVGDRASIAWALVFMGLVAWMQDHDGRQSALRYQEALLLFQELRDMTAVAVTQSWFAEVELALGDDARAQSRYEAALAALLETRTHRHQMGFLCLAGLGSVAAAQGSVVRAAQLLAAAEPGLKGYFTVHYIDPYDNAVALVRAQLGEAAFIEAWEAGKAMTIEQAIAYALQRDPSPTAEATTPPLSSSRRQSLPEPLSERELEVLRPIAEGLSNPEIAQKLYLSVGTIKVHTRNIYGKLAVNNRTEAVVQAQKLHLL